MISAYIGSITFGLATIMYILIVLGLPFGEFAMGGKYKIMPKKMRVVCAISILIQLVAIIAMLQTGGIITTALSPGIVKGICYFFAVYLSLNTIMNGLSNSKKEKFFATPLSFITSVCLWITAMNG